MNDKMKQAVEAYSKMGWNLIPVDGKQPYKGLSWLKYKTEKYPVTSLIAIQDDNAGIAVMLGESSGNLVGVDLDKYEAVPDTTDPDKKMYVKRDEQDLELIEKIWNNYKDMTFSQRTPRGYRLFFIGNVRKGEEVANGVDIRAGYVVLAPSLHPSAHIDTPDLKRAEPYYYEEVCNKPPMTIDGDFTQAFCTLFGIEVDEEPVDILAYIDKGVRKDDGISRNFVTCMVASWYLQKGLDDEAIIQKCLEQNLKNDVPDRESDVINAAKATIKRGYKYKFAQDPKETESFDDVIEDYDANEQEINAVGGANSNIVWEGVELTLSDVDEKTGKRKKKKGYAIIASSNDGEIHKALVDKKTKSVEINGKTYDVVGIPDWAVPGQWTPKSALAFAANPRFKTPNQVYKQIYNMIDSHVDVSQIGKDFVEGHHVTAALYAMATYFYEIFNFFPEDIADGKTGSGKSTRMKAIGFQCYHCTDMITSPTPAIVFRLMQANKPTILMDNIENMSNNKTMSDEAKAIVSIIDVACYKGGVVMRIEGEDEFGRKKIERWYVYGPKLITGVSGFAASILTRAICTAMLRTNNRKLGLMNDDLRVIPINDDDEGPITLRRNREDMYALRLKYYRDIEQLAKTIDFGDKNLIGRDFEVWKPLFVMAKWACPENVDVIMNYAKHSVKTRPDDYYNDYDRALIQILLDLTTKDGDFVQVTAITDRLNTTLGFTGKKEEFTGAKVGEMLRKLGFGERGRTKFGVTAQITFDMLERACDGSGVEFTRQTMVSRVIHQVQMRKFHVRVL